MKKEELRKHLMKLNNGNNSANIVFSLGSLDMKSESDLENMIKELTETLDREPTPEEIIKAFVKNCIEEKEVQAKNAAEVQQKMQRQRAQDDLIRKMREEQARKDAAKMKTDKLIEALRDKAGKEREKDLDLSNRFFADIPEETLPQVLEFLRDELGFEFKGNEHGNIEQDGRDITLDTITKEQLENGEVKLSISKEKLQSEEFEELINDSELGERLDKRLGEAERNRAEAEPEQDLKLEDKNRSGLDDEVR